MALKQISHTRKTLGGKAYQAVRDEIISLRFRPGEMIYENAIAAKLGVSRTPVREAFYMLQQEELIEILPQRGARVAYLSVQKMKDAQFIRESLEISAFVAVAKMWDKNQEIFQQAEKKINHVLAEQEKVIESQDYTRYVYLDEEFHNHFLELTNNSRLLTIVDQMRAHLNRMRYLELQEAHHVKESYQQHIAIFQAVWEKDERKTRKLLKEHLHLLIDIWPRIIEKNEELFN